MGRVVKLLEHSSKGFDTFKGIPGDTANPKKSIPYAWIQKKSILGGSIRDGDAKGEER